MSYSICINCDKMVPNYEKYCQPCILKYNLNQDNNWHRVYHKKINVFEEIEKDKRRDNAK